MVPAGIFGEGEQPTAVTCNYERMAERNGQTHRVKTDRWAVWCSFHCTAINLPHTYLCPEGCNGGGRCGVTHLTNSQSRHQRQCARWPGRMNLVRWQLRIVGPGCETWFLSLAWRLEFYAGSYIYEKSVRLWCRLLEEGCKLEVLRD